MAAARDTAPVHHKIVRILEIPSLGKISPAFFRRSRKAPNLAVDVGDSLP